MLAYPLPSFPPPLPPPPPLAILKVLTINSNRLFFEYLTSRMKFDQAAFPLLTCLLCISQSKFFLSNWTQFLTSTLASLKSKDSKVSRVALESLYRLLWYGSFVFRFFELFDAYLPISENILWEFILANKTKFPPQ